MTTAYRYPSEFGRALLRDLEGSARAAFHDHPDCGVSNPRQTARSIAKRAAGTIAADWPRLSAIAAKQAVVESASVQPGTDAGENGILVARVPSLRALPTARQGVRTNRVRPDHPSYYRRGLKHAHNVLGALVAETRRNSALTPEQCAAQVEALVAALRLLGAEIEGSRRG